MTDIRSRFTEAGYTYEGRTCYGDKFTKAPFTVYHSGYYLFFIRGNGMTRAFREDRLLFFTVADLERQTGIIPRAFDGKEDKTNYDYGRKF